MHAQMSNKELLHLVIDMLDFDPQTNSIFVSYSLFENRVKERKRLEAEFKRTGGQFVNRK